MQSLPSRGASGRKSMCAGALAVVALIAGPSSLVAQSATTQVATPLFDPRVTVGMLPNGLRYYIQAHPMPVHRAEMRLVVDAGSVLETPAELGVAHFVEHMAFNGSRRFAKLAIQHQLEAMGMQFGADLNASTTGDETAYRLSIPTDRPGTLATGMRILADWADGVTFDSAAVEAERGIIYGEWRLRMSGPGDYERASRYLRSVLRGSAYGDRLPIGDTRIIQHVSRAELVRFYKRWYRPQRMAVIVVGDIDAQAVERLVRQEMGAIPATPRTPETNRAWPSRDVPVQAAPTYVVAEDPATLGPTVSLVYRLPESPTGGEQRSGLAEEIVTSIVGDRVGEVPPAASILDQPARHARTWTLQSTAPGDIRTTVASLVTAVRQVVEHGFTDEEVERTRRQILAGRERQYTGWNALSSSALADAYQGAFLSGGVVPAPDSALAIARASLSGPGAITRAEVDAAARVILDQPGVVGFVGFPSAGQHVDAELVSAIADSVRRTHTPIFVAHRDTSGSNAARQGSSAAETDSALSARPLIASLPLAGSVDSVRQLSAIGVTVWVLSNGARVVLRPTRFNPDQILAYAVAPGGLSRAASSEYIDSHLSAQAISLGGLGAFSPDALQRKLSLAGSSASVSAGFTEMSTDVWASAAASDAKTMFELLHLKFTAPRLDTAAIADWKNASRAALVQPLNLAQQEFQARRSHFDPRQRPTSAAMMDSLDARRAFAFYRARLGDASNFTFFIVGAFSPDSLRPLVERYLASLPSTNAHERWSDNGARQPNGPEKIDLHAGVPGRTAIILSYTVPVKYDAAAPLRIDAIAQIAQRRVLARLRTQLSATYGVGLSVQPVQYPWSHAEVSLNFDADPGRADSLAQAALAVLDTLARSGPTPSEVAEVVAYEKQHLDVGLQENQYWLLTLSQNAWNGFDLSTGLVSPDPRAAALTVDALRATAAEIFSSAQKAVRQFIRPPT